ncbi:hypothetical protein C8R48DRAFT_673944 [Suillus tomentosus]|nr:hypothetical protein C8R48DRAFT_673944 [Suillus tomentosus]
MIPLSNDDFGDVQDHMEAHIHNGEGELSMYESSFFILEGKRIKLLTKDGQRGRFSGPEEALLHNLPDLNWEYMMNRRHGELLVDIGISFTPHSPEVPVIGLWRLDALEASFGAGGYKWGEMHHHNMLSRYGTFLVEMQQERSQQTHIAFRSTYNLYYESIQTNNNQVNFASDSDTYRISPSYMAECFDVMKVVDGYKEKIYGVRDEYRVSGHAARIMLDNIQSKRTQIKIVKKNPPNLGILTGVLNHMLRSTTSTPIIYDFHIRESLALLEYRNVLETSGMFFVHDFDLNSDTCLEDVQQIDDVHVLALMGVNAKAQRDRAVARMVAWQSSESELEDYSISRTPTWARLKAAISSSPGLIMREWTFPSRLSNTQLSVEHLFIMFTRQMWLMLTTEVIKGFRPYPNSLHEAMKCWTITSIDDTLAAVTFEACNAGLQNNTGVTPGRMGPKLRTFADRINYIRRGEESQRKAPRARRTMKIIKEKRIFAANLMDSQPFDADGNLRRKQRGKSVGRFIKRSPWPRETKEYLLHHVLASPGHFQWVN